jgi:hypothetical protein
MPFVHRCLNTFYCQKGGAGDVRYQGFKDGRAGNEQEEEVSLLTGREAEKS